LSLVLRVSISYKDKRKKGRKEAMGYIPLLSTVGGGEILQVVHHRDPLGLGSPEEVVLDRVRASTRSVLGLISKRTSRAAY
jgi:hypothetical protein